jgi:hypothetical protein
MWVVNFRKENSEADIDSRNLPKKMAILLRKIKIEELKAENHSFEAL